MRVSTMQRRIRRKKIRAIGRDQSICNLDRRAAGSKGFSIAPSFLILPLHLATITSGTAKLGQFGIGQAIRRKEDARFITGTGCFVDDFSRAGQAFAAFLRSPHAHAAIKKVDAAAARQAPGVLAVYTAADVAAAKL